MAKTFNRKTLRKMIEAGKVTLVSSYAFDDITGADRTHGATPVAIRPADYRECVPGVCYIRPAELTAEDGVCYWNGIGTVHLRVHSNSNYDFRIAR